MKQPEHFWGWEAGNKESWWCLDTRTHELVLVNNVQKLLNAYRVEATWVLKLRFYFTASSSDWRGSSMQGVWWGDTWGLELTRPVGDIMQSAPGFEGGSLRLWNIGGCKGEFTAPLGREGLGEITGHCTRGMVLRCGSMGTCVPSKCLHYPKSSKLPDYRIQRAALLPWEL